MWIGVKMINARSVERADATNDPMNFVAFFQQQISQIAPVLAGDAGDQRPFHLGKYCRTFDSLAPARSPLSVRPSMSLGARRLHSLNCQCKKINPASDADPLQRVFWRRHHDPR